MILESLDINGIKKTVEGNYDVVDSKEARQRTAVLEMLRVSTEQYSSAFQAQTNAFLSGQKDAVPNHNEFDRDLESVTKDLEELIRQNMLDADNVDR